MIFSRCTARIGILALATTLSFQAVAEDGGWESLFDGTTLTGWTQKNGTATYRVEDGTIIGKTTPKSPNSFLCSDAEFADFELEFEVKLLNKELNSGVQIRSQTAAPKGAEAFGRVNGPQVEIEATDIGSGGEGGYVYGEACGGWMVPDAVRKPHTFFKDGEWNTYRIVAKGASIKTWINGNPVADVVDDKKLESHPKGFIGLQVHGVGDKGPYEVAWRNVRIKELK